MNESVFEADFNIQQETEDQYRSMVVNEEIEREMVDQDNRVMEHSN